NARRIRLPCSPRGAADPDASPPPRSCPDRPRARSLGGKTKIGRRLANAGLRGGFPVVLTRRRAPPSRWRKPVPVISFCLGPAHGVHISFGTPQCPFTARSSAG